MLCREGAVPAAVASRGSLLRACRWPGSSRGGPVRRRGERSAALPLALNKRCSPRLVHILASAPLVPRTTLRDRPLATPRLYSGAPRGGADSQKPQGLGGWRGASYARRQGRSDPKSRSGARTVSGDARCGRGRRVWAAPKGQYCPPLNSARGAPRRGAPADRHHDPPTTVLLVAPACGPFKGRR